MKTITLIRWLSLLSVILLGITFLPQFVQEIKLPGLSRTSEQLLEIAPESITTVSITNSGNEPPINLVKTQDGWQVNGVMADTTVVQRLFDSLADSQINSVAARNQDTYVQLGVSSESAQLVVTSDGADQTIQLGKLGSTLNTFYAKKTDKPEVYLVRGSLLNLLRDPALSYVASESGAQSDEAAASAAAMLSPAQLQ